MPGAPVCSGHNKDWRLPMTLCPIALAVGCKKCALFSVCPVKGVIGDYKPEPKAPQKTNTAKKK